MLVWDHNDRVGTAEIKQGENTFTLTLRKGNAYLIAHYEYVDEETGEDMEQLQWFFLDKKHMKNMLGLNKREGFSENCMTDVTKLRLNKAKLPYAHEIAEAFTKAFDIITIEIYKED